MIKVFQPGDRQFTSNGDAVLKPRKATVYKEDNGEYYLCLECSIEDIIHLQQDNIIIADTPTGAQGFRINNLTVKNKTVYIDKAKHLYYDAERLTVGSSPEKQSIAGIMAALFAETGFTGTSDIGGSYRFDFAKKQVAECISQIAEETGGHIVRDNWTCNIKQSIGVDRGAVIQLGKNIVTFEQAEEWDQVVTKLYPVGYKGAELPEKYLTSKVQYPMTYARSVEFGLSKDNEATVEGLEKAIEENEKKETDSVKTVQSYVVKREQLQIIMDKKREALQKAQGEYEAALHNPGTTASQLKKLEAKVQKAEAEHIAARNNWETAAAELSGAENTTSQLIGQLKEDKKRLQDIIQEDLRQNAMAYLEENQYPKVNYAIQAHMEGVADIGDTVRVVHPKVAKDILTHVISYQWDCIAGKFKEIEFGNFKRTAKGLYSQIGAEVRESSKRAELKTTLLETALKESKETIEKYLFMGHRYETENATYFLDTESIETAVNVLMISLGGIAFSQSGINGNYTTAWTIDGKFNADFITAGTINAELIRTGTLASINYYDTEGKEGTIMDMETGYLTTTGESSYAWTDREPEIHNARLKLQNGRIVIEDITTGDKLFISPEGISTNADGKGASCCLDYKSRLFGESAQGNAYKAGILRTHGSPVGMVADIGDAIVAPHMEDRGGGAAGVKFAFSLRETGDGILNFGNREYSSTEDKFLYSVGLQFSKDREERTIYINDGAGNKGKGKLVFANMVKAIKAAQITKNKAGQITKMLCTLEDGSSAAIAIKYDTEGNITQIGDTSVNYNTGEGGGIA